MPGIDVVRAATVEAFGDEPADFAYRVGLCPGPRDGAGLPDQPLPFGRRSQVEDDLVAGDCYQLVGKPSSVVSEIAHHFSAQARMSEPSRPSSLPFMLAVILTASTVYLQNIRALPPQMLVFPRQREARPDRCLHCVASHCLE
jgi:hypothetical protein